MSSGLCEFTGTGISAVRDLLAEFRAEFDQEQRELEALFEQADGARSRESGAVADYDLAACQFAVLTQTLDEERQARRQQQLEITRELRAMRGLLERQLESSGSGGLAAGRSPVSGSPPRIAAKSQVA